MTLIASFAVAGFPLIFGDLLLTGPTSGQPRPMVTPAAGNVQDFFGDSGWNVAGLRQKVNIVSDKCIVAWAGSWLGAKLAIAELRRLSFEDPLTTEKVLDYLNSEAELKAHPASLVGLLLDGSEVHRFHFDSEVLDTRDFGTVQLAGSGKNAIHEFFEIMSSKETGITGQPGAPDLAISHALNLGSLLLQAEFRGGDTAATIRNMFGGGYEIAYFSDGKAQKLSDITYIFWEARVDANNAGLSLPRLLVKQVYREDHLLIRSIKIRQPAPDQPATIYDEQRHIISPLFDSVLSADPIDLFGFEFTSSTYCHCVATEVVGIGMGIYTKVQRHLSMSDVPFVFKEQNGILDFAARDDAIQEILQAIRKLLQPNPGVKGN